MTPLPWRRDRHGLPPLAECPKVADLPEPKLSAGARYLGTELASDATARVADHGLGGAGSCRLNLSAEALDVVRLAGAFRIPAASVRGAVGHRSDSPQAHRFAVRWQHGEHHLTTRFELSPVKPAAGSTKKTADRGAQPWVRALSKIAKENA
ncbi:hypothetical protein KLP28_00110 [Nocardioidaceae bacterium]|nr:hypothetical protein KLP28_00110 [Nocardioidaceae bacterium]